MRSGGRSGKGVSFRDFKKNLADVWESAGFTGEEGKAYRIENIFRTNMQSAYSAGRFQQMKRVAKRRPYWQYQAVQDKRTRATHAAMNGLVFPADDPIWNTWYPPNGYMCRCKVRSLSARQVEKRGIKVDKGTKIIQLPDSGFTRLPYASALAAITPGETDGIGKTVLPSDTRFIPAAQIPEKHILPISLGDILPQGQSEEYYLKEFFSVFGFDPDKGGFLTLPEINRTIHVGKELFIQKGTGKSKITKRGRERYLKLLAATIKNPYEIWSDVEELPDGSRRSVLKLIRLFRDDKGDVAGFAVFELDSARGWRGLSTYAPGDDNRNEMLKLIDKRRSGVLEYREGNKKPE